METEGEFWSHHRQGGCLGAHRVLVLAQNTEAGTDAQLPWSVIDGSWSVFTPELLGLSELCMDKMRQLGECEELQWTVGVGLGFVGVDWEVDWRVEDVMLSSIALEVTWISQNCQKGVMEHNNMRWRQSLKPLQIPNSGWVVQCTHS